MVSPNYVPNQRLYFLLFVVVDDESDDDGFTCAACDEFWLVSVESDDVFTSRALWLTGSIIASGFLCRFSPEFDKVGVAYELDGD